MQTSNSILFKLIRKAAAVTSVVTALFFMSINIFVPKPFAAEAFSFSITDCAAKPDRLISPRLEVSPAKLLGAATFELFYDPEILEFRSAKSETGTLEYKEKTGSLKLVYLSSDDTDSASLMTLTFKTKAEGDCNIDFAASDCVDKNANEAEVSACTSAEISVSKNAAETPDGIISDKQASDKSSDSSKSSKSAKSSENSKGSSGKSAKAPSKKTGDSSSGSTADESDFFGSFGSGSSPGFQFAAAGTAIGISASIAVAVIYFCIKHRKEKKKTPHDS